MVRHGASRGLTGRCLNRIDLASVTPDRSDIACGRSWRWAGRALFVMPGPTSGRDVSAASDRLGHRAGRRARRDAAIRSREAPPYVEHGAEVGAGGVVGVLDPVGHGVGGRRGGRQVAGVVPEARHERLSAVSVRRAASSARPRSRCLRTARATCRWRACRRTSATDRLRTGRRARRPARRTSGTGCR